MNSFFATGDATESAQFSSEIYVERWYFMSQLDVMAPINSTAVVAVGDSITDGLGSQPDNSNRWPANPAVRPWTVREGAWMTVRSGRPSPINNNRREYKCLDMEYRPIILNIIMFTCLNRIKTPYPGSK
jgi:hypothetical protein